MRSVLLATLLLLVGASAAQAAVNVEMKLDPRESELGDATGVKGTVQLDGAPYAGQPVQLEGRGYPFDDEYAVIDTATTGPDGSFVFAPELNRNWDLRVTAGGFTTKRQRAYVFPALDLSFRARSSRVITVSARYRVPRGTRLDQPTLFYVNRRRAKTAPVAAKAKLERTRPGRYRATAVVRLPAEWKGRFRYAACFRYTVGSGMGNPRASCPKHYRF